MSLQTLTDREREALRLIAAGMTCKGAARQMGITVNTMKSYSKSFRAKLRAPTNAAAAVLVALGDRQ